MDKFTHFWIRFNTMLKRLFQSGSAVAILLCGLSLFASPDLLTSSDGTAGSRNTPLVRAVQKVRNAVVNIHSEKTAPRKDAVYDNGTNRKVNGMGSGIVIDERGYIVTNHHVVHQVDALRVTLANGSTYSARVVSFDRNKDLAIIKIDASTPLQVMPVGTSSDVMLAESVFAVGNAFGYEHTVTAGIVSALSRDVEVNEDQSYERLIQTDASINPGNSGGPLLNLDGEVVGINVAIRAGAQRIGFAIPIDDARKSIAKLMSTHQLSGTTHGIVGEDHKSARSHRLTVKSAYPGGPGASAGLIPGDEIIRVGSTMIHDGVDLERAFIGRRAGESVEIAYRREGNEHAANLVVAQSMTPVQSVSTRRETTSVVAANDRVWTRLGMRLVPISATERQLLSPRYRGGLRVSAVRLKSSSDQSRIRNGDILLGLEGYETLNADNMSYVMNEAEKKRNSSLEFYLFRNGKLLKGWLRLADAR
jgi:serine protease Do